MLVEIDTNNNVYVAVVSQQYVYLLSRKPVQISTSYYLKKINLVERNYDIYDKELLTIVKTLKEFRAKLMLVNNMLILTDYKNLEYFTTTKVLTLRQVRQSKKLATFDFSITYRPGPLNVYVDALIRRPQDLLSKETLAYYKQVLLLPKLFVEPPTSVAAYVVRVVAYRAIVILLRRSIR